MATTPAADQLPALYKTLRPLSREQHRDWRVRSSATRPWLVGQHALPLTVDEFTAAQRDLPIVFAVGEDNTPLALMGLRAGVNTFVNADGTLVDEGSYLPAYAKRYPFALARSGSDEETLTLCLDVESDRVGAFDDGEPLFEGDGLSATGQSLLAYAEEFDRAGRRTLAFVEELRRHDLLTDGEITITPKGGGAPFIYRGFRIVDTKRLHALPADVTSAMLASGTLALIFAHLFSLGLLRDLFERQVAQGDAAAT